MAIQTLFVAIVLFAGSQAWAADLTKFRRIEPQYIAALADASARSGNHAQAWGLWKLDPGPRGVTLDEYPQLSAKGVAAAGWKFDASDWWVEEHGLLMESPEFPLPAGQYLVTGGRKVTAVLTVHPQDRQGNQKWELSDNATLYDVTHLGCRAARYAPGKAGNACSPAKVSTKAFPARPGTAMPDVDGCRKVEYLVLIVVGVPAGK